VADREPVTRERQEIDRVEWLGRRIAETLGNLDRSSQGDCELLISRLVQFELLLRDAERSASWNPTSPVPDREARIHRVRERARLARAALADAIENAALDEFAESARIHLGLVADDPNSATLEIPEPNASVRTRCLGSPSFFLGEQAGKKGTPAIVGRPVPSQRLLARPWDGLLWLLGLVSASFAARVAVKMAGRFSWLGPASLTVALVVLTIGFGPLALVAGVTMAGLGWFMQVS
jgi:hypothetical protein